MDNVLLDLSTKRDRPKISIDGKMYELYTTQDHSMVVIAEMQKAGEEAQALAEKTDITREDRKRLDVLIDGSIKRIVRGIKKRVLNKLSYAQKIQIIQVFTQAAGQTGTSRRHGVQSPDSSGSTEAIQ